MADKDVVYRFIADSKGFQKGVSDAKKAMDSFVQGIGQGVGQAVYEQFAAIPGQLVGIVTQATALGSALNDMSARTGVSAEGLQKLGFAAKLSGSSLDEVSKAVGIMQKGIVSGDADFKKLGLSVSELSRMAPEQAFTKVGAAIAGLKSPTEQAAAAMGVFGKSGASLLPMLQQFPQLAAEFDRLGISISDSMVGAFDDFGDAMDKAGMVWEGFKNNLAGVIVSAEPVHVALAGITEMLGELSKWVKTNQNDIQGWVTGGLVFMAEAMVHLVEVFEVGAAAFKALFDVWAIGERQAADLAAGIKLLYEANTNPTNAVAAYKTFNATLATNAAAQKEAIQGNQEALNGIMGTTLKAKDAFQHLSDSIANAGGKTHEATGGVKELSGGLTQLGTEADKATEKMAAAAQAALTFRPNVAGLAGRSVFSDLNGAAAADPMNQLPQFLKFGDKNKFSGLVQGMDPVKQDLSVVIGKSVEWDTALQNVANEFNTLGSLVGGVMGEIIKSIGAVSTGIAGIGSSIGQIKSSGGGIGGLLGKIGGGLGIAGAAAGIVGGIIGLFKKKKQPAAEVKPLSDQFDDAVKKATELGSVGDKNVTKLLDAIKGTAQATKYLNEQLDGAVDGIGKFMAGYIDASEFGSKDKGVFGQSGIQLAPGDTIDPQIAKDQATIFAATFWGEVQQKGVVGAADAMRASFGSYMKTLKALGGDADAEKIMGPIGRLMGLTDKNQAFRGAMEGAQGLAQTTTGLGNAGVLNQDTYDALGRETAAAFKQAMDAGGTKEEALAGILPALNALGSASENMGLKVGPELAGLMEQANEAGFKMVIPVEERIARATESMAGMMGKGWGQFPTGDTGGTAPPGGGTVPGTYSGETSYKGYDRHAGGGVARYTGFHVLEKGERVLTVPQTRAFESAPPAASVASWGLGSGPRGGGVTGGAAVLQDIGTVLKKGASQPGMAHTSVFSPVIQQGSREDPHAASSRSLDSFISWLRDNRGGLVTEMAAALAGKA